MDDIENATFFLVAHGRVCALAQVNGGHQLSLVQRLPVLLCHGLKGANGEGGGQIDDGIELLPATQYPFYGQLKIPWLTVPDFQYQRFSALRMHFTTQDFSSVCVPA